MASREQLLQLVHALWGAPGSDVGWNTFLDALNVAANGYGTHLVSVTSAPSGASVAITTVRDPTALRDYNTHWGKWDPWGLSSTLRAARPATVFTGEELVAPADYRKTAYYADFARRYHMVRGLIGIVEADASHASAVSVNRSEQQRDFGGEELALIGALMPHLQRALQVHRRLTVAEGTRSDLGQLIDTCQHAVLLVDARARVTFMNRAASRLLQRRGGLIDDKSGLRTSAPSSTAALRMAIAAAASTSAGTGESAGGRVVVQRTAPRRPLLITVAPLARIRPAVPGSEVAAAMVIVNDPDVAEALDEHTLGALLGLTVAEARLVGRLVQGESLLAAASSLSIRPSTARSRLKAIFEKTATHRQADLVRLALSLGPGSRASIGETP